MISIVHRNQHHGMRCAFVSIGKILERIFGRFRLNQANIRIIDANRSNGTFCQHVSLNEFPSILVHDKRRFRKRILLLGFGQFLIICQFLFDSRLKFKHIILRIDNMFFASDRQTRNNLQKRCFARLSLANQGSNNRNVLDDSAVLRNYLSDFPNIGRF